MFMCALNCGIDVHKVTKRSDGLLVVVTVVVVVVVYREIRVS